VRRSDGFALAGFIPGDDIEAATSGSFGGFERRLEGLPPSFSS
jgi:hypothetical protein